MHHLIQSPDIFLKDTEEFVREMRLLFYPRFAKKRRRSRGKTARLECRKTPTRKIRERLLKDCKFCFYCNLSLTIDTSTLDHAIPLSKGGKHDYTNFILSCYGCNQNKKDKIYVLRASLTGES